MDDKDDKDNINEDYQEEISYETYKLMLESQKEKEMDDLVENTNLTIQEKIIINLERELSQLNLEQKNILYSNDEMLKLYPNDKDIIESREINIGIYIKNEKKIKEIKDKIDSFKKSLDEENSKNNEKKDIKNDKENINTIDEIKEDKNKGEDIIKELEL